MGNDLLDVDVLNKSKSWNTQKITNATNKKLTRAVSVVSLIRLTNAQPLGEIETSAKLQ